VKTYNHSSKTRERVISNSGIKRPQTARQIRRQEARDRKKALASLATHDERAVKFHF
jgi:hypothetical protein